MRTPNFFIVGGPKCGTTAMWTYLKTHPAIFLCEPKEPGFLSPDILLPQYCDFKSWEEYLALFRDAQPHNHVIGEASVTSLFSLVAVPTIRERFSGAKLLAIVRNPIDALPSLHAQLRIAFVETEEDLTHAWELQALRRRGSHIPLGCPMPPFLLYRDVLSFGAQVQRLFANYPQELIHVELFDDFVANPRACYVRILDFLGLEDDGRTEFPKVNERWAPRVPSSIFSLWNFHRVPRGLRRAGRLLGLHHLHRFISEKILTTKGKPRPLSPDFRRLLEDEFREDILLLQELLGRDLSHWFKCGHGAACPSQSKDLDAVVNKKGEIPDDGRGCLADRTEACQ